MTISYIKGPLGWAVSVDGKPVGVIKARNRGLYLVSVIGSKPVSLATQGTHTFATLKEAKARVAEVFATKEQESKPKATQLRSVNKALAPHNVELVKGEGYFYYTFDDGKFFETESVYVFTLNQLSFDRWVADGISFAESIQGKVEDKKLFTYRLEK